jgi:ubiquinone/menaquinone biosynthesis C-methylase UbiE
MISLSRLWRPSRVAYPEVDTPEEVTAFIESRALEFPAKLEDEFASHALKLGVESGMVLDVGTRVGLTLLKILWQNENFYAIGMDRSGLMIERARETASAWELGERAFFQVGDARRMRFKTEYFDLVISDSSLHRFDDASAVFAEIRRVLKPKGALLIRDYQRPNRIRMAATIGRTEALYGKAMQPQLITAIRAAYTRNEIEAAILESGLRGAEISETPADDAPHILIQRRGETDPGSWVNAREQYR